MSELSSPLYLFFVFLCLFSCVLSSLAEPAPGRIPKVYNALITSNQNLEPSKAYPVYQPVLRSAAYPFPLQSVFYDGLPLTNSLLPPLPLPQLSLPKELPNAEPAASPSAEPSTEAPSTDSPPEAPSQEADAANEATEPAPPPPKTESPIPLNQFGLPPQVIPLGNFGSGYEYTHINTVPYSFPGLRFYNAYDPFLYNPYAGFPLYRPYTNVLAPLPAVAVPKEAAPSPKAAPAPESSEASQTPPPEPSDLNILNYSSKDPAIPNVPPPPLPQGGLKTDE